MELVNSISSNQAFMLKKKEEGTGLRFHRVLCSWFGNHQERSVAVLFFFGRRMSGHNMEKFCYFINVSLFF